MSQTKWDASRITDQKGRVIIVTGSTSGIGKETARVLARKNGIVILAVRNAKKGETVAGEIRQEYAAADVSVRELDLSSLESVSAFAKGIDRDYDRLDLLINNAGVMMCPYSTTQDGFEIQMGTNHLGHFALTGLLMPLLKKTGGSRIVALSSGAHALGNIDLSDLNWVTRNYNTQRAYGDSKLANLYFTYELARRLESNGDNPRVTAAHPGWTATDLQRHSGLMRFANLFFAQNVEMGALPTLRAAFDDGAEQGDFFGPEGMFHMRGHPVSHDSSKLSHDREIARRLWDASEELTGVRFEL
jgi:NAD(P)-dependent dehydrogenase (short-subunit alcohol dehydrogenase family)